MENIRICVRCHERNTNKIRVKSWERHKVGKNRESFDVISEFYIPVRGIYKYFVVFNLIKLVGVFDTRTYLPT